MKNGKLLLNDIKEIQRGEGATERFGRNLREFRKFNRWSLKDLAEELEISIQHLSDVECGHRMLGADKLERLREVVSK